MSRALLILILPASIGCIETINIDVSAESARELIDLGDTGVGIRSQASIAIRNNSDSPSIVELEVDGELSTAQYQFWFTDRRWTVEAGELARFNVFFFAREVMDVPANAMIRLRSESKIESRTLRARGVPSVKIVPDHVDFGTVEPGGFAERTLMIDNLLGVPLSIKKMNTRRERFALVSWSEELLPAESSTEVRVRYTPGASTTEDRSEWTFTYCDDPVFCTVKVDLSGRVAEAERPCIEVDQQQIDFGALELGKSREGWITLRNTCDHTVDIQELDADVAGTRAFRTDAKNISIAAGGCHVASVYFYANSDGMIDSELLIRTHDPTYAELRLPLRGFGLRFESGSINGPACHLDVRGPSLFFGEVAIGREKTAALVLDNIGSADCTLGQLRIDGENFALDAPTPTIVPGASELIEVRYRPSEAGADRATARFTFDPSSSETVRELTGTGVAETPQFAPEQINFGTVAGGCTAASSVLAISNPRAQPMVINWIGASSKSSPDFSVATPELPLVIAPGATYNVPITYAPQLEDMDSGAIIIREAGRAEPYKLWMIGRGERR